MTELQRKPKRKLSEAELAQRRAAAPKGLAAGALAGKSTGPKTPEGKANASRNAWKHGRYSMINRQQFGLGATSVSKLFGKPCLTTCPFHPDNPQRTEAPCSLVLDGLTHAGGPCLDKTVYVTALQAMLEAMKGERPDSMDGMHGLLATEMAANLQIVHGIRASIAEHGVLVPTYERNKEGELLLDPETGKPMVFELKLNPALAALAKFTDSHGINFAEMLATPRAREKLREEEDGAATLATAIGAIMGRAQKKITRAPIDGEAVEVSRRDEREREEG